MSGDEHDASRCAGGAGRGDRPSRPSRLGAALSRRLVPSSDWPVLLLLLLALALDYAERTLIGALGPTLEQVFHFGNTALGVLGAASGIVAAIATMPFGLIIDRARRTWLLALSLLIWMVAVGVAGASVSLAMFFGARLLLGAVAAVTGPAVPSLVGDLVPAGQRGRALGLTEIGQLVGIGLGFILAAVVTAVLSFRWCFWLLGGAGAVTAVGFWRAREPPRTGAAGPSVEAEGRSGSGQGTRTQQLVRDAGIEPSPRAILTQDPDTMSLWDAVLYVVRVRTDLIVLSARAIGDYFLSATGTFGVVFATRQYGLSQRDADLAILVLGLGALAGFLAVGRAADALLRRRHLNGRLWLGALGYLLAPLPLYPALRTHDLAIALPLFTLGAFFVAGAGPPLDAVRVDVVVPKLRGRAEAIRQVLRTAAEGGAPALFGVLAGALAGGGAAGLQSAFIVTLPVLVVSGLVLLIALRTYAPDVAAALASTQGDTSR